MGRTRARCGSGADREGRHQSSVQVPVHETAGWRDAHDETMRHVVLISHTHLYQLYVTQALLFHIFEAKLCMKSRWPSDKDYIGIPSQEPDVCSPVRLHCHGAPVIPRTQASQCCTYRGLARY